MEKKIISTELTLYDSPEELPSEIQRLFEEAIQARDKAYAPILTIWWAPHSSWNPVKS